MDEQELEQLREPRIYANPVTEVPSDGEQRQRPSNRKPHRLSAILLPTLIILVGFTFASVCVYLITRRFANHYDQTLREVVAAQNSSSHEFAQEILRMNYYANEQQLRINELNNAISSLRAEQTQMRMRLDRCEAARHR